MHVCDQQDKGTLDALLCGDDDVRAASQLLGEVWRLLAPGTAYVMITSGGAGLASLLILCNFVFAL